MEPNKRTDRDGGKCEEQMERTIKMGKCSERKYESKIIQ